MHNYFTNYHTHWSVIICEIIVHLLVIVQKNYIYIFNVDDAAAKE